MKDFFQGNPKLLSVFLTVLIYTAVGSFVYFSLANQKTVEVGTKEKIQPDESLETHPASVYLVVNNGKTTISYHAKLDNKHNLIDLFEFHIEKSGLKLAKTDYTYGLRIEEINGVKASEGFAWKIFDNDVDVTNNIKQIFLEDDHTYKAVYTKL